MMRRIFPLAVLLLALGAGSASAQNCSGQPLANTICAGPTGGGTGLPSFRAMVSADLPSTITVPLTLNPASGDALTINPLAATQNRGFVITQTGATATITGGPRAYNEIIVTNPTMISTTGFTRGLPTAWYDVLHVRLTPGQTVAGTFQSAIRGEATVTAAITSSYVAGVFGNAYMSAANSNPGAGLAGINGYAIVDSGGSIGVVQGMEAEVGLWGTGTAIVRAGLLIDNIGLAQGSTLDAAIVVTNFTGWAGIATNAGTFKNLVALSSSGAGGLGAGFPLSQTGSFFISDAAITIDSFANLSNVTVNGNILSFPNVLMKGTGLTTLGSANTPDAQLTVNNNSGATVAPPFNAAIHLVGADSALISQTFDGFGSFGLMIARAAGGTRASKSAVGAAGIMFELAGQAWDGSAYASNSVIILRTLNAQTGTDHSSVVQFQTVAATTTTLRTVMQIHGSGGVAVGAANAATDPGTDAFLATDLYSNNVTFLVRTKATLTNAAAANTATLTNAPAAGNPTKWFAIDDNGTSRKVPAW